MSEREAVAAYLIRQAAARRTFNGAKDEAASILLRAAKEILRGAHEAAPQKDAP